MHQKHAENLKSQLTDYNVDSFEDSSAICISTGQEIDFSVLQGLLQVSELGNEKYLNFVKERLVEGEKSIFEPISKSNDQNSNKKDKQVFGVLAAKPADLHETFSYPITSLPLSIVSPDFILYQSDKADFTNYIMKSSNSVSSSYSPDCKMDYWWDGSNAFFKTKTSIHGMVH